MCDPKMSTLLIIGIVIVLIVIIGIVYYVHQSNGATYITSLNGQVLYHGTAKPYVSSDDMNRIVVAHGNKIDVFNEVGVKSGTVVITEVEITGVAFNAGDNVFMAMDSNGNLYLIDEALFVATAIDNGYSILHDTVSGYYAKKGTFEFIVGDTNDKAAINGDYGLFEIHTKVVR